MRTTLKIAAAVLILGPGFAAACLLVIFLGTLIAVMMQIGRGQDDVVVWATRALNVTDWAVLGDHFGRAVSRGMFWSIRVFVLHQPG